MLEMYDRLCPKPPEVVRFVILPSPTLCSYPRCKNRGIDKHHITYHPEAIKPLCRSHHEEITIINGQQARKYRVELSNKHRWWIWYQWLEGKLKARRTQKAMEYIEWDTQPPVWREPLITNHSDGIEDVAELITPASKKKKGRVRKKKVSGKRKKPNSGADKKREKAKGRLAR